MEIMRDNLPSTKATQEKPNPYNSRRERYQMVVDERKRERSPSELADACRSLLYGKRYSSAETLFQQHHLSRSHSPEDLDIDLCNVFLEHYLFQQVNHEKAERLLERIGKRANLATHVLMIRSGLRRKDYGLARRHYDMAVESGIPSFVIESMPLWSSEEMALLKPLMRIGQISYSDENLQQVFIRGRTENIFSTDDQLVDLSTITATKQPIKLEDDLKINRITSKLGGVELMSQISDLFLSTFSLSTPSDRLRAQIRLEEACLAASRQLEHRRRLQKAESTRLPEFKGVYGLISEWSSKFSEWLEEESEKRLSRGFTTTSSESETSIWSSLDTSDADYFCALLSPLSPEKVALLTVSELVSVKDFDPELGGVKLVSIAQNLGRRVREEMLATVAMTRPFLQRFPFPPQMTKQLLMEWHGRKRVESAIHLAMAASQERLVEESQEAWLPSWSTQQAVRLGSWLISGALSALKGNHQGETPFYHSVVTDYRTGHSQGIIRPSPAVLSSLLSSSTIGQHPESINSILVNDPWALPMLVPPRPWLTLHSGGYIQRKTAFVRLKDDPMHYEVIRCADAEGLLDTVKRGLDVLGSTPWTINKDILRLQIELWNEKIDPRTLQPFHSPSPTAPPRPQRPPVNEATGTMDPQSRIEFIKAMQEWQRERARHSEMVSTQCDTNYKLEIAKMFSHAPEFYMPHSVDFRGRAYTIPPHLSHISSDPARGLLLFSEGKALGERGLFWLKVHLANLAGFDKASLEERAAWCEARLEEIKHAANDPKNSTFWKEADEPWQCLAACIELTRALACPEGPQNYLSRLPVQQDGSCNGLQHYAALGRDPEGAAKVNLAPSDRPQDVYRSVSDLVQARLAQDVLPGSSVSEEERLVAQRLVNKVNRKIVKTTVMTNVYGVTEYGAREQLKLRMMEAGLFIESKEYQLLNVARNYLARLVFASLKELFVRAKAIQDWLTAAAEEIVHAVPLESAIVFGYKAKNLVHDHTLLSYRRPVMDKMDWKRASLKTKFLARYPQTMVSWTTPLHFPVIQPYSRARTVSLYTALQQVSIRSPTLSDPVDPSKQAAAFPPNFIHSLDASHMFKTALECNRRGVTFASVHDCFWTHAATVDEMSRVIREQFVELYSEDVLSKLREEFLVRYKNYYVPVRTAEGKAVWRRIHFTPVPARGPFDLTQVLESKYFFS